MKNNQKQIFKDSWLILVALLLSFLCIAWLIIKPEFFAQMFAILASVFLGAAVTAWATNHLIGERRKAEEEKEKSVQIHQQKVAVYSDFIDNIWKQVVKDDSDEITSETLSTIRDLCFSKFLFCINDTKRINEIIDLLEEIKVNDKQSQNGKSPNRICAKITDIVRKDLFDDSADDIVYQKDIVFLPKKNWGLFFDGFKKNWLFLLSC